MSIALHSRFFIIVMNALVLRRFANSFVSGGKVQVRNSLVQVQQGRIAPPNLSRRRNLTLHVKSSQSIELEISTIEDMEDVGAVLSMGTVGGDVLLLDGDLGAGKTCFSRGFVRARTGVKDLRVTSPTYLLSNTYPTSDDDGLL